MVLWSVAAVIKITVDFRIQTNFVRYFGHFLFNVFLVKFFLTLPEKAKMNCYNSQIIQEYNIERKTMFTRKVTIAILANAQCLIWNLLFRSQPKHHKVLVTADNIWENIMSDYSQNSVSTDFWPAFSFCKVTEIKHLYEHSSHKSLALCTEQRPWQEFQNKLADSWNVNTSPWLETQPFFVSSSSKIQL